MVIVIFFVLYVYVMRIMKGKKRLHEISSKSSWSGKSSSFIISPLETINISKFEEFERFIADSMHQKLRSLVIGEKLQI